MDKESYQLIDGIKCYHPQHSQDHEDYPFEGFEVTDEVEEKSFWCRSRNRLLQYLIKKFSQHFSKPKFLEVGCGTGFTLEYLTSIPNLSLTGSELYLRGLNSARKRLPEIEFIQLNIVEEVPFTNAYEMVGAFDVIEHIDDDIQVIKNVNQILTKGGYFIIAVPQYKFMWSRLDELVSHKRRYSYQELSTKLQAQGFEIAYRTSFVFMLFPAMLLSRLVNFRKPKDKDIKAEFASKVTFNPIVNSVLGFVMRLEECLIKMGLKLPFGGSLVVVAKKIK